MHKQVHCNKIYMQHVLDNLIFILINIYKYISYKAAETVVLVNDGTIDCLFVIGCGTGTAWECSNIFPYCSEWRKVILNDLILYLQQQKTPQKTPQQTPQQQYGGQHAAAAQVIVSIGIYPRNKDKHSLWYIDFTE